MFSPQKKLKYIFFLNQSDEEYFSLSKNHTICGKNIYDSPLRQFMTDLEQNYGYDEYTNLAIYTLYLLGQKDSIFKPYLGMFIYN
jgi:hypothetical protein